MSLLGGLAGGALGALGGIIGGNAQKDAARKARDAQIRSAQIAAEQAGLSRDLQEKQWGQQFAEYQRRQALQERLQGIQRNQLSPYITGGQDAYYKQLALAGIGSPAYEGMTGTQAQTEEINNIANSPILQELMSQGETGILQNASATGGLRGGNVQGALAQFRPQMINQEIINQYARLGQLANLGQNSILNQPVSTGTNMPGVLSTDPTLANIALQSGDAQAAAAIAQGKATANMWGDIAGGIGWGLDKLNLDFGDMAGWFNPSNPDQNIGYSDMYGGLL